MSAEETTRVALIIFLVLGTLHTSLYASLFLNSLTSPAEGMGRKEAYRLCSVKCSWPICIIKSLAGFNPCFCDIVQPNSPNILASIGTSYNEFGV